MARPRKNTASSQWQTTLEVKNEPKVIARPASRVQSSTPARATARAPRDRDPKSPPARSVVHAPSEPRIEQRRQSPVTAAGQLSPRRDDKRDGASLSTSSPAAWPSAPAPVFETINLINLTGTGPARHSTKVASPPRDAASLKQLPSASWKELLSEIKRGEIEQLCVIVREPPDADPTYAARERPPGAEPK